MYRDVTYFLDTEGKYGEPWRGYIILKTWDENGNRTTKAIPHTSYLYYEDTHGKDKSLFGTKIKKKTFKNTPDRNKWLKRNVNAKVYECLNPTAEFLQEEYNQLNTNLPDFTKHSLKIGVVDIEIAIGCKYPPEYIVEIETGKITIKELHALHDDEILVKYLGRWKHLKDTEYAENNEFPEPDKAAYPVNLITVHNSENDMFTVFAYDYYNEATINNPQVKYIHFKTEKEMLRAFLNYWQTEEFDVISGWNSFSFDMLYLYKRLENQCFEGHLLSTTNNIRSKKIVLHGDARDYIGVSIEGITQLDYLMLYKKFVTPVEGEKPSYSLQNICMDELGRGKVEYSGSLKQLWTEDWQKFVEYNIEDVKLVVDLDKKRGFFKLARALCNMSLVEYEKIFSNMNLVVGNVLQFAREKNTHIPFVRNVDHNESYEGAFVKEPKMKAYKKGVCSFDVQSLYPNIMIALNMSPETYVGKVIDEDPSNVTLRLPNKQIKKVPIEKFDELFKKGLCSYAGNKAIFSNKKEGLLPAFLKQLFNDRLKVKRKLKKAENNSSAADMIEQLNVEQLTKKIILNSTYGVCALKYSPFYNINIAEGITLTGQKVITESNIFIEQLLEEKYNAQDVNDIITYNDTDSVYANMDCVVDHLTDGDLTNEKNIKKIVKEIDNNITPALNQWCEDYLSKEIFHTRLTNRIKFIREKFCDVAYFFKKKRYLLHVLDDEGKKVDKFTYTGISLVRSTYPAIAKDFLKSIYEKAIGEKWTEEKFKDEMISLWQTITSFTIEQASNIALSKNLNCYKEGSKFMLVVKRTPGHAAAALYHNHLIKKLNLLGKYDEIKNGRVKICYVKPDNIYGIKVIGFRDEMPEEFAGLFEIDYQKMFEMLFIKPLKDFCKCNTWRSFDPKSALIVTSVLDL